MIPTATGAEVAVHPHDAQWRTAAVPVPWRDLLGDQDPLGSLVFFEEQGPVALVGGRERKMPSTWPV